MSSTELDRFVDDVRNGYDHFQLAAACLRFSDAHMAAGFDATHPSINRMINDVARFVPDGLPPFVLPASAEGFADYIRDCDDPALAARAVAIVLSQQKDFLNNTSQLTSGRLEPGDVLPVPARAPRELYRGEYTLSMNLDDTRDASNPGRVVGLTIWRGSDTPNSIHVDLDLAAGGFLDEHLKTTEGFRIALIQPNVELGELRVDTVTQVEGQYQFFGVQARSSDAQRDRVLELLALADGHPSRPVLALFPELCGDLAISESIQRSSFQSLKVIVGPSYHEVREQRRRNVADVTFVGAGRLNAQHHKAGKFKFTLTEPAREALGIEERWPVGVPYYERVERPRRIRLMLGRRLSMVVLICADLLDPELAHALEELRPTMVLVSSMTHEAGDFVNAAAGLVARGQTTTIMINNPRRWPGQRDPETVVCVAPVRAPVDGAVRARMTGQQGVMILDLPTLALSFLP